jgi:hypothetical protein
MLVDSTTAVSLGDIERKFDELVQQLKDQPDDDALKEDVAKLVKDVMFHETPTTRQEVVTMLNRMSETIKGNDALRGLVLNNLGCVQRRLGDMKAALHNLRSAAEAEGGISSASPVTLLNIASVYSALQMYAEAAAVSNHAAYRCETSLQPVPVMLHAAALHNLGAALEGSGEIEHAQQAYKTSLNLTAQSGVPEDHPQLKATQNALAQLELKLRNQRARSKRAEWSSDVERTVIQKSVRKLNEPDAKARSTKARKELSSSAPPSTGAQSTVASRRLMPLPASVTKKSAIPAVRGEDDGDVQNTPPGGDVTASSIHLSPISHRHDEDHKLNDTSGRRSSASRGRSPLSSSAHGSGGGSGLAYGFSVKKFHVFREKGNGKMLKYKKMDQPAWDTNPFIHEPSRRIGDGSDVTVERSVSHSFVPHQVVPLFADLRYKETTRRNTIKRDFAQVMQSIRCTQDSERIFILEDEVRIEEEIQELRERRVLVRWMKAKEVFVRGSVALEAEEKEVRMTIMAEHIEVLKRDVRPTAQRLQAQAIEEVDRGSVDVSQEDARNTIITEEETAKAVARVEEEITFSKRGLAHGLVMWCMEGVVSADEAALLADPAYANSHFVLQRHNWFGKPFGHGGKADSDVENKVYLSTSQISNS